MEQEFVYNSEVKCWILDFKAYLLAQGLAFPVEQKSFFTLFSEWTTEDEHGRFYKQYATFGYLDDDLRYFKVYAQAVGHIYDSLEQKEQDYHKWQSFLEEQLSELPRGLQSVSDSGEGVLEEQRQVLHSYFEAIGYHEIGVIVVTLAAALLVTKNLVLAGVSAITCTFSFFISTALFSQTRAEAGYLDVADSISITNVITPSCLISSLLLACSFKECMEQQPGKSQEKLVQKALTNLFGSLYYFSLLLVLSALPLHKSSGNLLLQSYSMAVIIATAVSFLLTMLLNTALLSIFDPRANSREIISKFLQPREEEG